MVVSYGQLFQIMEPDSWRQYPISEFTKNWFVLTGANDALTKCHEADKVGRKGGFEGGYCWHEALDKEGVYYGTPLYMIHPAQRMKPNLYPFFYEELCKKACKSVKL